MFTDFGVPIEFLFPFLIWEDTCSIFYTFTCVIKTKAVLLWKYKNEKKYTEATIKKLPKKNQKYDVLDSEVIGLRIYVQTTDEKSFYLQMYIKEFKYSKKNKIGDWPEMSISGARKLVALIKADNVQGKDSIVSASKREAEKTLGDVNP